MVPPAKSMRVGADVKLTLLHEGDKKTVNVKIGEAPTKSASAAQEGGDAAGLSDKLQGATLKDSANSGVAVAEAQVGKGRLVLCGPQVLFRAQPDGTYKYLFNSIVRAAIQE